MEKKRNDGSLRLRHLRMQFAETALIQPDRGNVLWDCLSLIDDETVGKVNALGGVSAIAHSEFGRRSLKQKPNELSGFTTVFVAFQIVLRVLPKHSHL